MKKEEIKKELELVSAHKSARLMTRVSLVSVVLMALITLIFYVYSQENIRELSNRVVFIDSNGITGTGEMKTMEDKEIAEIQMKAAIKYAVPYLYAFNSANYDKRIEKGLLLYGESGKQILSGYLEDHVREKVFNENLEVSCQILNVDLKTKEKSGKVIVVFNQTVFNGSVEQTRKLTAELKLTKTQISDVNPWGYLIDDWVILKQE